MKSEKNINLYDQYKSISFTGGNFAKGLEILDKLFAKEDNNISTFLSLSGALVPAGLQMHIVELINTGKIAGVVTTGATLTHDYLEALGYHHKKLDNYKSDSDLRKNGINRILDVGASDESFEELEKELHSWMENNYKNTNSDLTIVSTVEFLKELGSHLPEHSILGACTRKSVPIYCPAITDSMLGVHCMTFAEFNKFKLDPIAELKSFVSQCFDSKVTAAIVLGGGVPKNYLFQGMLISGKELDYAIQITMDRPEHGGLSGATLDEAISWGKIQAEAKLVTIIADVTIILPMFVDYIKKRGKLN